MSSHEQPRPSRRASLGATLTSLVKATITSEVNGGDDDDAEKKWASCDMELDSGRMRSENGTLGGANNSSSPFSWRPPHAAADESAELQKARDEITDLRALLKEQSYRHELEVAELRRQYKVMKGRLEAMGKDMKDKLTIHEYAKMIKEAAPQRTDSAYVIKIQSQMAKALHELGIMGNQLTVLKQSSDEVVRSLHADMSELVNEKCRAEQEFMNEMIKMEGEKKAMTEHYEERGREKDEMIETLKKEVEEARAEARRSQKGGFASSQLSEGRRNSD